MPNPDDRYERERSASYPAAFALALAVLVLMIAAVAAWRALESYFGLRAALAVHSPTCMAARRVSLPSDGWRLADGSFVLPRRAVPASDGSSFLFNDNAGRARCFRPLD